LMDEYYAELDQRRLAQIIDRAAEALKHPPGSDEPESPLDLFAQRMRKHKQESKKANGAF